MVWFSLVPLLAGLVNQPPFSAFKLGLISGAAHYITLVYWIVEVLGHYGQINIVLSLFPFLLLCLYLALYPAFFSLLWVRLMGRRFSVLLTAGLWVSIEYVRSFLLTGFPWCLLGHSQYRNLSFLQVADLAGVYGLSFLIVLVNACIFFFFFRRPLRGANMVKGEFLITACMVVFTFLYGHGQLTGAEPAQDTLHRVKAVIVQPNIDQSQKWDPRYQMHTLMTYQRLTRRAFDFEPRLIVWPETSVPFFFQDGRELSFRVLSLAKESGAILVFGSPAFKKTQRGTKYYNRVYALLPGQGGPPLFYDKVHLVPFGEYVPLRELLFFVNRLVPAAGDFEPGETLAPLRCNDLSLGVLICFEAIFPELARRQVRDGADILLNLTNDAWFGMTSAPYQHLSMAVFRAVENRRPLIRAANTGFSGFIDSYGRIIEKGGLFEEDLLKGSLSIGHGPPSFYTRFGDTFALGVIALTLIALFYRLRRTRTDDRI